MLRGIDVSNWQSGLSLSAVKPGFCIAKATEGNFFVDKYCDGFIQECIALGIPWGFYHFAREYSPEDEAKFFYDNCTGYVGRGIPVLDYEVWGNNDNDVKWCERFLAKFHDLAGVWPLIYISASHCTDFQGSWVPGKCGLWVAGYPHDTDKYPGNVVVPYNIEPWEFAAIWQFTSGLILKGYNGPLDGDVAFMDKKAWGKYAGVSTTGEKIVEKPKEEKKVITGRVTIEVDG